jgi:hypothetical protein
MLLGCADQKNQVKDVRVGVDVNAGVNVDADVSRDGIRVDVAPKAETETKK